MDATAKYDFDTTAADELSFRKGDHLKILGTTDDWYSAELNGKEGFVPKNYIDINLPSWYQEAASRGDAEGKLMAQPAGAFLIRSSKSGAPGQFSISVRDGADVQHFKVLRDSRGQYYLWEEKFPNLNLLVEFYKGNSISKQNDIFLCEPGQQQRDATDLLPPLPAPHAPHNSAPIQQRDATDHLPPLPAPQAAPRQAPPSSRQVRALYNFQAEERDELNFSAGDVIEVLENSDPAWWRGQLRGQIGLFPSNYTMPL